MANYTSEMIRSTPEAHNAYSVSQFGMQYLLYSIYIMNRNNRQIEQHLEEQNTKAQNLQELLYQQVSGSNS